MQILVICDGYKHPASTPREGLGSLQNNGFSFDFLTTKSEHGTQPGGWRRSQGAGRVSVLTPGHYVETWLHPSFQALLVNVLKWCGNPKI